MPEIRLEDIDLLRERAGVSYRKAREVLLETDGDVVEALIRLEEGSRSWQERFQVQGAELVDRVKELIHEGNVTRIIVKQQGKTILEIPVTIGAIGAVFLPTIAALGVIAALVTRCTIVVERRQTDEEDQESEEQEQEPLWDDDFEPED